MTGESGHTGRVGAETHPAPALVEETKIEKATWRSRRAWVVLLAFVAAGLAADLWSKHAAFAGIAAQPVVIRRADVLALPSSQINRLVPVHEPVVVLPSVLELKLVLNPGAVFGIGAGKRWVFVLFTVGAVGFGLWVFARWTKARDWWSHAALGLILAGGLGNLYDRLTLGCVRDFLHPLAGVELPFGLAWPGGDRQVWPYVSNVADALLLLGIGVLMVRLWRAEGQKGTGGAGGATGGGAPGARVESPGEPAGS